MASNLSTKNRYENDISDIDDYQSEEQQRRLTRQTQVKLSNDATHLKSKRVTSRKLSSNTFEVEKDFDASEYISTEQIGGKTMKTGNSNKSNLQKQQPRQPKKERSLTGQTDEVKFQ